MLTTKWHYCIPSWDPRTFFIIICFCNQISFNEIDISHSSSTFETKVRNQFLNKNIISSFVISKIITVGVTRLCNEYSHAHVNILKRSFLNPPSITRKARPKETCAVRRIKSIILHKSTKKVKRITEEYNQKVERKH